MESKSTVSDEKVSMNEAQKTLADQRVKGLNCLYPKYGNTMPPNDPCDETEGDTRKGTRVRKVGKKAKNWLQPPLRPLASSVICPPSSEQSSQDIFACTDDPLTNATKVKDNETYQPQNSFQPILRPGISVVLSPELEQSNHNKLGYRKELQTDSVQMDCSQTPNHPTSYPAAAKSNNSAVCPSIIEQSSRGDFSSESAGLKTDSVKMNSSHSSELPTSFPPVAKLNTSAVFPSAVEQSTQNNSPGASENKLQTNAVKTDSSQASEPSTSSEDSNPSVLDSGSALKKNHLTSLDSEFTSYKILPMATGVKSAGNKVATFCVKFDGCQSIDWTTIKNNEIKKLSQVGSKSRSASKKGLPKVSPLEEVKKRAQCTANTKPSKSRKKEESLSTSAPSRCLDKGDTKKPQGCQVDVFCIPLDFVPNYRTQSMRTQGVTNSKGKKVKPEISQEDRVLRMIKPWLFGGSKCCMPHCNSYSVQGIKHFRIPHGRHRYSERDCVSWTAEFQEVVFKYRSDQKFTSRVKGGSAYICELHFNETDFINGEKRVRLKYGVVPTRHLYYKQHTKRPPPEKIKCKRGRPRKGFGKKKLALQNKWPVKIFHDNLVKVTQETTAIE